MYLARAQASKRASDGGYVTASRTVSKLLSRGTGHLSSSLAARQVGAIPSSLLSRGTGRLSSSLARQVGAIPTARASGGLLPAAAAHGPRKGLVEACSARLMRDQQTRSLGLFSGGGGVSHQRLKELERLTAQSPSDANVEVI